MHCILNNAVFIVCGRSLTICHGMTALSVSLHAPMLPRSAIRLCRIAVFFAGFNGRVGSERVGKRRVPHGVVGVQRDYARLRDMRPRGRRSRHFGSNILGNYLKKRVKLLVVAENVVSCHNFSLFLFVLSPAYRRAAIFCHPYGFPDCAGSSLGSKKAAPSKMASVARLWFFVALQPLRVEGRRQQSWCRRRRSYSPVMRSTPFYILSFFISFIMFFNL
jgi:hypothetical protein